MKLKHYFSGAMLMALMASCSNDLPEAPGQILENETTTYVRVSIIGDALTRAGVPEYADGSKDESAVNSILLTFYDGNRHYVGKTLVSQGENLKDSPDPIDADKTVERVLTFIAEVELPENSNHPEYVVAYVNPTSASSDLLTDRLEDAMQYIRERASVSHTGYRTMNNSVYYNENLPNNTYNNGEKGRVRFATPVNFTNQFFKTREEAEKADATKTIEITVERVEAKVKLSNTLADISVSEVEGNSGLGNKPSYSLKFVPETWFVNGKEKRTFLIKNFRDARENYTQGHMPVSDLGMSWTKLKAAFTYTTNPDNRENQVNDESRLRSYWAVDPTYFIENETGDIYPDISYDVKYGDGDVNANATVYPLEYESYAKKINETENNYVKFTGSGDSKVKSHEYVLENTMSMATLKGVDAMASMTSVVLLGHYVIKKGDGTTVFDGSTLDTKTAFYVRHFGNSQYIMLSDNEAIDFLLEQNSNTLYVQKRNQDGSIVEGSFEPLKAAHIDKRNENNVDYGVSHGDFILAHPWLSGQTTSKLSEQWRTLTLSGVNNTNLFIYDSSLNNNQGGYRNLTTNDKKNVEASLYDAIGVLEKFQSGKAYFNVPLKHIWGADKTSVFDANSLKLGDYGVVRNHIYDLTINKITGLGTGIGDVEQPIVPPTKNEKYYISAKLNILKWRVVKQTVDL